MQRKIANILKVKNIGVFVMSNNKVVNGLFWKTLERIGVLGIQLTLKIILARLLEPEHYGILALMMVFITMANIFVQNGFSTALIQKPDVMEEDYSSVFWISFGIASVIYAIIFVSAPFIASFYNAKEIVAPLRVLSLMLFPGALNSVQLAKISRDMDFRKLFYSNLIGVIISGLIGIAIALRGGGLWALVIQSLFNTITVCLVMKFTGKLKIRFLCNKDRMKPFFSFGWKLIVSSFLNNITEDIRSLVIGGKYNADTLGNYNQGMQFPQYGINIVQGSIGSVILPALSRCQSEKEQAKLVMKNTIKLSTYIVFPMMAGMAAVSNSFVRLFLTEKWIFCVPYMKVYCLVFAFYPIYVCNLQAINAMGRSDIYLKIEVIKQLYNIAILAVAVFCFQTPMAIAMSAVVSIPFSIYINAYPNRKLIGYTASEQVKDFLPSGIVSIILFFAIYSLEVFHLSNISMILLQIIVGITLYILLSLIFRVESFWILFTGIKSIMRK